MVNNASEEASLLFHVRDRVGHSQQSQALRRVSSDESDGSNDSLVAGPIAFNFNEPLPNPNPADQESDDDLHHTSPIQNGDAGQGGIMDMTLSNAVSNASRENLQTVISQLGLEIPLQSKSSSHSHHYHPQHLHSSLSQQQPQCCRHATHNISIESLDLDVNSRFCHNHNCCSGGKFQRRKKLLERTSCSSIH